MTAREDAASAPSFVCVYFGDGYGCLNCGGSTHAEDGTFVDGVWQPDPSGEKGPFEGDPRYCSEDCFADAQEDADRWRRHRATEWCPSCGFDQHEHAPDCGRTKVDA